MYGLVSALVGDTNSIFVYIGILDRVFANGLGDQGTIPVRVIEKTQKWYLITPRLTQHYKVRIKRSRAIQEKK